MVLEIGAGAGNTAFPIVRGNENPELRLHALDFSQAAVATMRASPDYNETIMRADVWDVAQETNSPPGLQEGSVDLILLIFIFSALSPTQWRQAISNLSRLLKPGAEILFRDYGRGDLAQVRFRHGRWMQENFYVRGDGTRVYFFELDELRVLWRGGADGTTRRGEEEARRDGDEKKKEEEEKKAPAFEILDLDVDRRLIVNRRKKIKMYRCWIQGRFRKPLDSASSSSPSMEVVDQNEPTECLA